MRTLHVYTDGACAQNGTWTGGWGFVVADDLNKQLFTSKGGEFKTTNNRMELTAYLKALIYLRENQDKYDKAHIYTDSAYIDNAFRQNWVGNWLRNGWVNAKKQPVANKDLWVEILNEREKAKAITTNKVKGHSTDVLNNVADRLAVEGKNEQELKNTNNSRV